VLTPQLNAKNSKREFNWGVKPLKGLLPSLGPLTLVLITVNPPINE